MKRKTAVKKVRKALPAMETPAEMMSSLILEGDLSKMTAEQRVSYALHVGKSLGLNMATKPFDVISLSGKIVLYANKNCAEQLRKLYGVSVIDQKTQQHGNVFVTIVQVQDKKGRTDTGTGAVDVAGLTGDKLANAIMKSETKAKRRGTLSICGLGMLDETEIETIPNAQRIEFDYGPKKLTAAEEAVVKANDAKLESLSSYIKDGFKLLGYSKKVVWQFCEDRSWNQELIKKDLDKVVEKQS